MNVPKPLGVEFDFRRQSLPKADPVSRRRSKGLIYFVWTLVAAGAALTIASFSLTTLLIVAAVLVGLVAGIVGLFVHLQNHTPWC